MGRKIEKVQPLERGRKWESLVSQKLKRHLMEKEEVSILNEKPNKRTDKWPLTLARWRLDTDLYQACLV